MTPYVMLGHSPLFGDYVDIIHALGGYLSKVVVNTVELPHPKRKSLEGRVEEYKAYCKRSGVSADVKILNLDVFSPQQGERYVVGFRGIHVAGYVKALLDRFPLKIESLIHPDAVVSPTCTLGVGVAINPGTVIASFVSIGDYCVVNRGATIGHDCKIDNFANVGPGAHLASNVHVARGAAIGIGAKVIQDLEIGENAFVAGGAVVLKDVAANTLVAGVPAVFKRNREPSAPRS